MHRNYVDAFFVVKLEEDVDVNNYFRSCSYFSYNGVTN